MLDNKKTTTLSSISNITIFIIVVFAATAISGYGRVTNIVAAIGMILFLLLHMHIYLEGFHKDCIIAFLLFFTVHFISSLINVDSLYYLLGTNITWVLIEFTPLFIGVHIFRNEPNKKIVVLFTWLTIVWFSIVIISIIMFLGADMGGRSYAQSARGNLLGGGYPTAYGSAILAVLLTNNLRKSKVNRKTKLLMLVGIVLSVIHVFVTQSVITIVALVLGIILAILFGGREFGKNPVKLIIGFLLIIAAVVIFVMNIKNIGMWMIHVSDNVGNPIFAQRIQEVGLMLYSDTETFHMGARMETLTSSINAFLQSPLWGVSYKVGNTFELLNSVGVGTHSEILDSLAKYGLLGAIPLFAVYYYNFRFIKSLLFKNNVLSIVVTILILSLFNPFISAQTGFMVFLYVPLTIKVLNTRDQATDAKRIALVTQ